MEIKTKFDIDDTVYCIDEPNCEPMTVNTICVHEDDTFFKKDEDGDPGLAIYYALTTADGDILEPKHEALMVRTEAEWLSQKLAFYHRICSEYTSRLKDLSNQG